MDYLDN